MKIRYACWLALLSLLAVSTGCGESEFRIAERNMPQLGTADAGSSDDITSGPGSGTRQTQDLAFQIKQTFCEKIFSCCTPQERRAQFGISDSSAQACSAGGPFSGGIGLTRYEDSLNKGRLKFDRNAAARCLDEFQKLSCSSFATKTSQGIREGIEACGKLFIPQVKKGNTCKYDQDCKTGFCQKKGVGTDVSYECADRFGEGDSCDPNQSECAEGLYCKQSGETCAPRLEKGESCEVGVECKTGYCGQQNGQSVCAERPVPSVCQGTGSDSNDADASSGDATSPDAGSGG